MLESAIPQHLRCSRAHQASTPPGFLPPYPAYSVRFPESVSNLTLAIIGAQYRTASEAADGGGQAALSPFLGSSASPPSFFEWTSVTDAKGFYNVAALAYWPSAGGYETWATQSGFREWWQDLEPENCQHGWFLEVFFPTTDRFESAFTTTQTSESFGHMKECMSEAVQEHGYWGSMRDRFPAAQVDPLVGGAKPVAARESSHPSETARIKIPGKKNLTVIRSGQDWLDTPPEERQLYLETMHPVLIKGMNFLRDHGEEVGCYSCRLMDVVDPSTMKADKDRTFGLAYFDDLASLESWSRKHPTHLAIFGGFHRYAKKLGNNVALRLSHEVMVLRPEQQFFEYVACHSGTGMLKFQ
ncbi:hem-containing dehydratase protein [Cladorrhinum sp. PSN332]|nr:hem-containing dehydratase protein [Cladorrhinum sp. PSN332]